MDLTTSEGSGLTGIVGRLVTEDPLLSLKGISCYKSVTRSVSLLDTYIREDIRKNLTPDEK